MALSRRLLLVSAASILPVRAFAAEPILAGVSGPLTGPNAQYGAQWKRGFDLALDEINGAGGVNGRPLAYTFEDSQSDPRQSVAIAQKFVSDPRIIIELGDFSSPASMAASPIYQRGKLVQFGFTNSHPDFTKGGDYMWSNSTNQAEEQPKLAEYAIHALGLQRPAVLHLNTDWGRTSKDAFAKAAASLGAPVVATEAYLPTDQDFRPSLVRVRDAKPDGLVLLSYYADAALLVRQARDLGLKQVLVGSTSIYSPKFIELAGAGGKRRVLHDELLSGRDAAGGAEIRRRLSREISARIRTRSAPAPMTRWCCSPRWCGSSDRPGKACMTGWRKSRMCQA